MLAGTAGVHAQEVAAAPAVTATDDDGFVAAHRGFWRAFSNRDLWGISELWDIKDPLTSAILPAASTPSVGWLAVADSFRHSFAHNRNIKIDVKPIRWQRQDDVAWLVSAVRFEAIQTQTGQPIRMDRMLVTEIFERRRGAWKMIHYHAHFPSFDLPGLEPNSSDVIPVPIRTRDGAARPGDDEIWGLYERFYAALEGRDLDGMMDIFSADGTVTALLPKSPVPFVGRDNVSSSWKRSFDEIDGLEIEASHTTLGGSDQVAWIMEYGSMQMILKDAPYKVLYFPIMATYVFRKEPVGWRLAHYHSHLSVFDDGHSH